MSNNLSVNKSHPIFKYKIGYNYSDNNTYDFVIIDRKIEKCPVNSNGKTYINNKKYYKIRCKKCEYEFWRTEYLIKSNQTCPVCGKIKRIVKHGINDISTTDPWMVKYFINGEKDACLYTHNSRVRVDMICPDCGAICKNKSIYSVYLNKKLSCYCQDTISYPNKFLYSLFKQLNLNFESEKRFNWSGNKRYDFLIHFPNGQKAICENNGGWHYVENKHNGSRTLKQEIENDVLKKELALKNGIDYYIILDCRKSNKNWIMKSIINSELKKLVDLSLVDFDKCNEFANKNLTKIVCDFYESHKDLFLYEIQDNFHISHSTLIRYLIKGNELGLCKYIPENSMNNSIKARKEKRMSPIYCAEFDKYYESISKFSKEYENENNKAINISNISAVCRGKKKSYYGLHFSYISKEQFNSIKDKTPHKAIGDYF